MNSSFCRSASRSASSARFRSVMSRATFDAPMTRPSRVAERGDGQGDVEPAAVLGHPHRLEVLDPLPAAEPRQDLALLVRRSGGMIRVIGWPTASSARVAEEPLGPGVPRADDAVERLADDRVVGRLDDGRQPRLGLLGPPALGDVAEDQDRPDRGPGLVPDGGGAVVDGPLRPVPGDEDRVVRQPDDRPLPQGAEGGVLDRLAGLLVDDVEDVRQRPAQRPRPGASRSGPRPRRS